MSKIRFAIAALAATGFATVAIADDRPPTNEEAQAIEQALRGKGFTAWGKIELDDGKKWEIDNAVHEDGRVYDVELSATDLSLIKKELED
jgi:opacity protein-like surface antigen